MIIWVFFVLGIKIRIPWVKKKKTFLSLWMKNMDSHLHVLQEDF